MFVASSAHELGYYGMEVFVERRPGIAGQVAAWLHLGANVGAATGPGNTLQSADDDLDRAMTAAMTAAGLTVQRRAPRGAVPGGEAGVVQRAGGRYLSIIG